ncbi:MAG: SPOR domain-containing protein [Bacteroidia bacterium]|nr:SPOR domain-containing protein [Bacteroidia bacterium]
MFSRYFKISVLGLFMLVFGTVCAQNNESETQQKVNQLIEKKAEYHRLTNGEIDGYRIKIHFGVESENAKAVRTKFSSKFPDINTYQEYQQPNFVVLVGDYKTKIEAVEALKKVQVEFNNAFIVKGKIKPY